MYDPISSPAGSSEAVAQDTIACDGLGNVAATSAWFGDRYQFTEGELKSETGLRYNRARYYDPTTGRWTSQEPLGFSAGDSNLYRYVANQPTALTDPGGQNPFDLIDDLDLIRTLSGLGSQRLSKIGDDLQLVNTKGFSMEQLKMIERLIKQMYGASDLLSRINIYSDKLINLFQKGGKGNSG
jgi:RHS repeat-associated protein